MRASLVRAGHPARGGGGAFKADMSRAWARASFAGPRSKVSRIQPIKKGREKKIAQTVVSETGVEPYA